MRRRFWRVIPLLLALVLVAGATACSKANTLHWAKVDSSQTRVEVSLPTSNPYNATNRTAETHGLVANWLTQQWRPHPDLHTGIYEEFSGPGADCPNGEAINCFEVWFVPDDTPNPIAPQAAPPCWNPPTSVCAIAKRFADPEHWRNGNTETDDPARIIIPLSWLQEDFIENALCHEGGHMYGLEHHDPVDTNGDGTPDYQPIGPCDGDLVDPSPDRDTDLSNNGGIAERGYDWSELDANLDRGMCHAGTPHGVARDINELDVNATAESAQQCDAGGFSALEVQGDEVAEVIAEPAEVFGG